MTAYKVFVINEKQDQEEILSVPCADKDTAVLVGRNLQSLFPQYKVVTTRCLRSQSSQPKPKPQPPASEEPVTCKPNLTDQDLAELESSLFVEMS